MTNKLILTKTVSWKIFHFAVLAGEIGISGDLELRHSAHKKWNWQLSSTIKTSIA